MDLNSFGHYLGCSVEGLLQVRQPNLTQYSLPKQLLSKSLLCPRFFPFKSPENRRCCLHGQNMTCNPMARHLDHVFACLTSALTFLQPFPYFSQLVPIVFPKYFPLLDPSQIIPTFFPDHSQFCLPPLTVFYPCFSKLIPMASPIVPKPVSSQFRWMSWMSTLALLKEVLLAGAVP